MRVYLDSFGCLHFVIANEVNVLSVFSKVFAGRLMNPVG